MISKKTLKSYKNYMECNEKVQKPLSPGILKLAQIFKSEYQLKIQVKPSAGLRSFAMAALVLELTKLRAKPMPQGSEPSDETTNCRLTGPSVIDGPFAAFARSCSRRCFHDMLARAIRWPWEVPVRGPKNRKRHDLSLTYPKILDEPRK